METPLYDQLAIIALAGRVKPTAQSYWRHVMRWYSKTFSTPLHVVATLPEEDVWLAFFEEKYEELSPQEMADERRRLLESPEERKERERREEADLAAEMAFIRMTEEAAAKPKAAPPGPSPAALLPAKPATPVAVAPAEEDVEIEFVEDPAEIERILGGDSMSR